MPVIKPVAKPCGIVYPGEDHQLVYLPLEQLDVHADIVDVSATVTLTQTFWQCSPTATPRMKYVFPVPAQAAVCGFEMHTEDGRIIRAVVKEKEKARREHEQAVQRGQLTGLVEHVTDDVFTLSLGCLPQLQLITTKLTYVMDLMEDDFMDQIRFQLPVSVGMRYGTLPAGMVGAKRIPADRIKISVDVFMRGVIKSLTSPSHPMFSLHNDGVLAGIPHVHRRAGQLISSSFLSADFVLSIKADGLDTARCFAERSPAGTVAMQLTVVPKFKLPPIASQDYIFLVDRSGSMGGRQDRNS
ncbi:hypothetical protein NM688_g6306 [Phlebia brevispora]|uniref:Uncharacterized protein n=1 Tax=Phlebia brevispora TaxID=194682 RepID=A0ACC1SHP2_9APHY|nr:hypothetical protein NM688_g6306 [Phlebia brevispora]